MFNYRPNLTWNIHYSPAARPGIHLTLFGAYLAVRNVKIVNYNFRNFFLQEQNSLKKTKSEIIIKKNLIHSICKCQIFFMPFKPAIISNLYSPIPTHNKMDEKKSLARFGDLFSSFVLLFMKLLAVSSGIPSWVYESGRGKYKNKQRAHSTNCCESKIISFYYNFLLLFASDSHPPSLPSIFHGWFFSPSLCFVSSGGGLVSVLIKNHDRERSMIPILMLPVIKCIYCPPRTSHENCQRFRLTF